MDLFLDVIVAVCVLAAGGIGGILAVGATQTFERRRSRRGTGVTLWLFPVVPRREVQKVESGSRENHESGAARSRPPASKWRSSASLRHNALTR